MILIVSTIIIGAAWLFYTVKTIQLIWKKYPLRGIIKFFTLEMVNEEMKKTVAIWLVISAIFSIIPCIWSLYLTWKTDYSFLIGLFPIMWYYTLTRYLFLEKKDLT